MNEPDLLPLSALQLWVHCTRQRGLIHLEQAFDDNSVLRQTRPARGRARLTARAWIETSLYRRSNNESRGLARVD